MAYLVETGVYEPAITKVGDSLNDESNLQLANRTKYLNNALNDLTRYIGTLKDTNDLKIEELTNRINSIRAVIGDGGSSGISTSDDVVRAVNKLLEDVQSIQQLLGDHEHNYAGSSYPGGPASQIDVLDDQVNQLSLLGTDSINTTKAKRNTNIYMEENALHASVFYGNLYGEASEALKLAKSPTISLTGDVLGSTTFSGDTNVSINATLKEQNISPGQYGENTNRQLDVNGSILIPNITVGSDGVITSIQNQVISLPEGLNITGKISATQDNRKLFIIGADAQNNSATTYSQNGVYEYNNRLFSNGDEVVTINQIQNLENKTINGRYIDEAASRKVDDTVGGTKDSNALITSDAVYRHEHNYAKSDVPGGAASEVEIQEADLSYKPVITGENNHLYKGDIKASIREFVAPDIIARDNMTIPGGKIWIEKTDIPDDSGGTISPADFLNPNDYFQRITQEQIANGVSSAPGKLMSYRSDGFVLADNKEQKLTKNLAIAISNPDDSNQAKMLLYGAYNIGTDYYDGLDAYVGQNGGILYGDPSGTDFYKRKIGYVKENELIFMPEDYGASERLDLLEMNLDSYVHPDENFTWELDEYGNYQPKDVMVGDHMWNVDGEGDIMPGEHPYPNPYWEWEPDAPENIWACGTAISFQGMIYVSTKNSKVEIIFKTDIPHKVYYIILDSDSDQNPSNLRYWKDNNTLQWKQNAYAWKKIDTDSTSQYAQTNMWESGDDYYWMYDTFTEWGNLTSHVLEINGVYYDVDDLTVYQRPFYVEEGVSVAIFIDVENGYDINDIILVRNI